jgi:hypothetical protein
MKRNYFYKDDIVSVIQAEETIEKETKKLKKSKRGFAVAAISMAAWIIGVFTVYLGATYWDNLPQPLSDILALICLGVICVGFLGCLVSYFLSGSVFETLKIVGKIGFWGWFILPFPYDILTGFLLMFFTLCAFFACPIAVLGIIYLIRKKRIKTAEKFLAEFASVQQRYNVEYVA